MNAPLRVLDLFSGIGGFSLGLERTGGFKTVAFCEIEPFCRRVLAKHWPEVPCYDDVRTLTAERLAADGIQIDVICGGFPCQDVSDAGQRAGIEGSRSGLFKEYARLIRGLGPSLAILENVSGLRSRGLDQVLRSLAEIGYDAIWHCIPASAVGAPHQRDRIWILAYPASPRWPQPIRPGAPLFDPEKIQLAGLLSGARHPWVTEPDVGRVADGLSTRVDCVAGVPVPGAPEPTLARAALGRFWRITGLGNAVIPQIPELIGRAVLSSLAQREAA